MYRRSEYESNLFANRFFLFKKKSNQNFESKYRIKIRHKIESELNKNVKLNKKVGCYLNSNCSNFNQSSVQILSVDIYGKNHTEWRFFFCECWRCTTKNT